MDPTTIELSEARFLLAACRQILIGIRKGRAIPTETAERHIRVVDDFFTKFKAAK